MTPNRHFENVTEIKYCEINIKRTNKLAFMKKLR
jgi:hypothetical protein